MLQIFILALVAAFLFWRLWSVLGTRTGNETEIKISNIKPLKKDKIKEYETTEKKSYDEDIADYIELESESGEALKNMKFVEKNFSVGQFVSGAKGAYETILMAFENGELSKLKKLLSNEVFISFEKVVLEREKKDLEVEASFVGMREIRLKKASFDKEKNVAEIQMLFKCELIVVVKNKEGKVIEGSLDKIKKQNDLWTFSRKMGTDNPNWELTKTGT
tara:strand:- start:73 stop:729 length:657 start_codon:yes stop_codon:yes gene_type:complete